MKTYRRICYDFLLYEIYMGGLEKGEKCKHTDGGIHDTVSDFYYVTIVDQHSPVIAQYALLTTAITIICTNLTI